MKIITEMTDKMCECCGQEIKRVKTPKEWYDKKRKEYIRWFNYDWEFIPWDHWAIQETLMRIAIEKRYFGLTTFDEDVMIANTVIMRDKIKCRQQ